MNDLINKNLKSPPDDSVTFLKTVLKKVLPIEKQKTKSVYGVKQLC